MDNASPSKGESLEGRPGLSAGAAIGWCVLAAGIAQIPAIVGGLFISQILPRGGSTLLLLTLPSGLLLIVGGAGLILRKPFAYYCVYLATFFGGIGGFKQPYIPFLKRFINLGPATEDLFLVLNLLLVSVLLWEHWKRTMDLSVPAQKAHRAAMMGLVVLGIGSIVAGRMMIHREKGQKSVAASMPGVGASFVDFNTRGPLSYVSVETQIPRAITLVFSGNCAEADAQALAQTHKLTKMEKPEAQQKFLPQVKAWKLREEVFPSRFSPHDSYYVGRLKQMPKVSLQLVYRKSDGRFTAQVFGLLPKGP